MFKEVVFISLIVFVAWILIFQLFVPFLQGVPFFPFFRSKVIRTLEAELAEARQDIAAKGLQDELKDMTKPKSNRKK
jgi:hypothetical protein